MFNNLNYSSLTPATGEQSSWQNVIRTVNFDRYEIQVELTASGNFLRIISIKVQKSFIESMKNRQISDVHDVEEFYRGEK